MEDRVSSNSATARYTPSIARALAAALETTQKLLTGTDRGRRWKALTLLAAMAGLVGTGATPPPLGLVLPLWSDPSLHHALFDNRGLITSLVLLALFLILMGGIGRSFSLGFLRGLVTGNPNVSSYRDYLRAGGAHFVWSAALTLPLYGLLFGTEALVAHDTLAQITRELAVPTSTDAQLMALALRSVSMFLLVLIPWTLFTLPMMVTVYELVPATMVTSGLGPVPAFRHVVAAAAKLPGAFATYLGVRYLLQFVGNLAAFLALLPCLLVSSPIVGTFVGGGWQLSRMLGGPGSPGGAALLTIGVLFAAIALYVTLCAALLPVSVFVNGVAVHWMRQIDQNTECLSDLVVGAN